MIDIEAAKVKLAEQGHALDRYQKLRNSVHLLENRNDVLLDITDVHVTAGGNKPPTCGDLETLLLAFVENEWSNGNLQDQFMNWAGEQLELIERNLKL